MKGVQVQFEGIVRFLEGRIGSPEQNWECFILNIEKMTLETLKLVSIVFQQTEDAIPREVVRTYGAAVGKLKEYYRCRPKFEMDKEEEYQPEYDEVSRYLDNKPEVITNDAARGELYKFLTLTEEKESNTRLLLESIPRFSYGNAQPIAKTSMHRQNMLNFPICNAKQTTGSTPLRAPTGKTKKKEENQVEGQTQTEYDKATIKDIIAQFSKIHLASADSICDFATEMADFMQHLSENTGVIKEESVQVDIKSDAKKKKPK